MIFFDKKERYQPWMNIIENEISAFYTKWSWIKQINIAIFIQKITKRRVRGRELPKIKSI